MSLDERHRDSSALPVGTLVGVYRIDAPLGDGGRGISEIADNREFLT